MDSDVVLWIVVATALAFDFTNGFHDTANAVATSISTRAMAPRVAVSMAAILNFVGAFLSLEVAATIASGIVEADLITPTIVFAGPDRRDLLEPADVVLRAAVVLLARADRRRRRRGVRRQGADAVLGRRAAREGRDPGAGRARAGLRRRRAGDPRRLPDRRPAARRARSSAASGSARSSPAACSRSPTAPTTRRRRWASSCWRWWPTATCRPTTTSRPGSWSPRRARSRLGTYVGGWRIIKTMGSRIIKMDPAQGFAAQGAGAAVILSASHVGFPLSTTHVISGAVMGAGAAKRRLGGALGRRRQHRRRVGAHAARGGGASARSPTASRACSATARPGRWSSASALVLRARGRARAAGARRRDADGGGLRRDARRRRVGQLLEVVWVSLAGRRGVTAAVLARRPVQRALGGGAPRRRGRRGDRLRRARGARLRRVRGRRGASACTSCSRRADASAAPRRRTRSSAAPSRARRRRSSTAAGRW